MDLIKGRLTMDRETVIKDFLKSKNSEEFDQLILEDLDTAYLRAMQFLGVDLEDINAKQPLVFSIPEALYKDIDSTFVYTPVGIRYDMARYNAFFFGQQYLYFYTAVIDHKIGQIYNDATTEISYYDIKGIQTAFKFREIKDVYHQILELRIILDGKDIVVPFSDSVVSADTELSGFELDDETLATLTDFKKFLRQKMSL